MSNITFVIGNGVSRQPIDLEQCKQLGLTIGCNAIIRDFEPHIISAADPRMVKHTKSMFHGKIYTRPDWNKRYEVLEYPPLPYKGNTRPDDPWHWNSGPHAINIACTQNPSVCYLLGFDLTQNKSANNVYMNTEGYNDKVIDPKYWHYQINKLIECYAQINFVWIVPNAYVCPAEWVKHTNFSRDTIENFNKYLHGT